MKIFKYRLQANKAQSIILMPEGAKVLTVQVQMGEPYIWAIVDESKPLEKRTFWIVGTGHEFDFIRHYVGTFQAFKGNLIWHVFCD